MREGKAPPPSVYPRLADGTLVDAWTQKATGFPKIPGVRFPKVIQQPSYNDYGPLFATKRHHHDRAAEGDRATTRCWCPKSDADGNDLGTLLPPEVAVPLGTYTGWNLRRKVSAPTECSRVLQGSFIPFAVKESPMDPRPPIGKRYADVKLYRQQLDEACGRLVNERYLLAEDRAHYGAYGAAIWDFVGKR